MADEAEGGGTGQPAKRKPSVLTKAVREAFLSRLAETADVAASAAGAGIGCTTVYGRRRRDAAFAHAWRLALLAGYDRIEGALIRRALGLADHAPVVDPGTGVPLERGEVDVDLALALLDRHRGTVARATKDAQQPFRATRDAAETTLLSKIRAYAKTARIAPPFPKVEAIEHAGADTMLRDDRAETAAMTGSDAAAGAGAAVGA